MYNRESVWAQTATHHLKDQLLRTWPVLALLALTGLFFHQLAFSGLILGRGDTYAYFYPYWAVRNAALMQGALPLWSPDIFGGVPLLANPQPGTFYPPNWPLVPFAPPDGIRLSVLAHSFWALLGAWLLARRWLKGAVPALVAAAIYGLGGYAGAHVEQINQFQGLAWLPWLFLLYEQTLRRPRRYLPLLALALALQFLAGHTQTVFITGVGLGLFGLMAAAEPATSSQTRLRHVVRALLLLALAGLLIVPLVLPQLIPTLELTGISNRSGGLNPNEATSFSFHPLIIGRGLLPSYDSIIFGEFVAYGGVIGLGLALVGLLVPRSSPLSRGRWWWGALMLVGLLLALGEFNPLYWQLAHLPGFSSFRVPARWLVLFTLGMALLAGAGVQHLLQTPRALRWPQAAALLLVLIALALSSTLARQAPQDVIGPAMPTAITWAGWGLALAALVGILLLNWRFVTPRRGGRLATLALLALLAELFMASRVLPYNLLVLPESYHAQRFTISQLLAYGAQQTPPGRVLSISDLLFDPGDRAALERRYQQHGFSDLAVRISHIATKLKEIAAPNLPLIWGIPSIDGFDGGLLPTRHYTAFSKLILPPGTLATLDGRLREILAREACRGACIPDQRWLNLTNTRYLITDKVFDLWHEDVAYDTTFAVSLQAGEHIQLDNTAAFEFTAVDVLYTGDALPVVVVEDAPLSAGAGRLGDFWRVRWVTEGDPLNPPSLELRAEAPVTVHAVTLIDRRTDAFVQLVPDPNWRRVLSSDIKLYENQAVLPRAFVVTEAHTVPDSDLGTAMALEVMRDPTFDPARTAVIHATAEAALSQAASPASQVTIDRYTPESIEMRVQAGAAGYLIVTDSYYPGWRAQVNGEDAPIYRADVMFRAIPIPAGASEVVLAYRPAWWPAAQIAGGAAWLVLLGLISVLWRKS